MLDWETCSVTARVHKMDRQPTFIIEQQALAPPCYGSQPVKGGVPNVGQEQMMEFKYNWVLFMNQGRVDQEINRQIGAVLTVIQKVSCLLW